AGLFPPLIRLQESRPSHRIEPSASLEMLPRESRQRPRSQDAPHPQRSAPGGRSASASSWPAISGSLHDRLFFRKMTNNACARPLPRRNRTKSGTTPRGHPLGKHGLRVGYSNTVLSGIGVKVRLRQKLPLSMPVDRSYKLNAHQHTMSLGRAIIFHTDAIY